MTEQEYIESFMEGALLAPTKETLALTLSSVWSLRKQVLYLQTMIKDMDELAAEIGPLAVKCKGCGEYYDIPCDFSEFNPEYSYCNSGHGGAYHCAP